MVTSQEMSIHWGAWNLSIICWSPLKKLSCHAVMLSISILFEVKIQGWSTSLAGNLATNSWVGRLEMLVVILIVSFFKGINTWIFCLRSGLSGQIAAISLVKKDLRMPWEKTATNLVTNTFPQVALLCCSGFWWKPSSLLEQSGQLVSWSVGRGVAKEIHKTTWRQRLHSVQWCHISRTNWI